MSTDTFTCVDCGETADADTATTVDGYSTREVCETCRDENYTWCESCENTVSSDEAHEVTWQEYNWPGGYVRHTEWRCEDCCRTCDDCGSYFREDDLTDRAGNDVCETCADFNYSYCEECDEYYANDDAGEHVHTGCDCVAPAGLAFRIRNDGAAPLANDTRLSLTLAAGEVSEEGMAEIARALRMAARDLPPVKSGRACSCGCGLPVEDEVRGDDYYSLRTLANVVVNTPEVIGGATWQTRQGNLPKRLSRYAWNTYKLRLSPDLMSTIGNIGSAHSRGTSVSLEVTRDLNLPAEDFYHAGSCWWGGYSESRCALKTTGGFGLRTFGDYGQVTGRAWVMPMRLTGEDVPGYPGRPQLVPTHDTMTPDAFIVFNGYGDLSGYTGARIMAHLSGKTYRKVDFTCDYMYVNAGGYLVAPEAVAEAYTDGSVSVSLYDEHRHDYATPDIPTDDDREYLADLLAPVSAA